MDHNGNKTSKLGWANAEFLQSWYLASWVTAVVLILPFTNRGTVPVLIFFSIVGLIFKWIDNRRNSSELLSRIKNPNSIAITLTFFVSVLATYSIISMEEYPNNLYFKAVALFIAFLITQDAVARTVQLCLPVTTFLLMLALVPVLIYLSWGESELDRINNLAGFYNRVFVCLILISFALVGQALNSGLKTPTKRLIMFGYLGLTFSMGLGSVSETSLLVCIIGWLLIGLFHLTQGKICRPVLYLTCLTPILMPIMIFALDFASDYFLQADHRFATHASVGLRMDAWRIGVNLISEKPLFGWGIIPFSTLVTFAPETFFTNNKSFLFVHPHNGFIQIWVQLGALGAITTFAVMLASVRKILKLDAAYIPFASVLFISSALVYSISHGAWQGWWAAELILLSGMVTGFYRKQNRASEPKMSNP